MTGDDYTIIDSNLGLGAGNPLSPNAAAADFGELSRVVPEPVGVWVALAAGASWMTARRRWKQRV